MKPILFNTEMVRAILDGRKTVTRRVIKTKYKNTEIILKNGKAFETVGTPATTVEIKSPYNVGDVLYVRETWNKGYFESSDSEYSNEGWFEEASVQDGDYLKALTTYVYRADFKMQDEIDLGMKWRPSIHMPKEEARIFLRVIDVRVERLQDCGNMQAKDEGCTCCSQFIRIWNSTVKKSDLGKYGWAANPWVWVIEFERISKEEAYGAESRT